MSDKRAKAKRRQGGKGRPITREQAREQGLKGARRRWGTPDDQGAGPYDDTRAASAPGQADSGASSYQQPTRREVREGIILEDGQRLGDVMDPWQRQDFERLDDPAIRHCFFERPRGHSKTSDIGTEAVVELIAGRPNQRLYCFAADEDQARLVYDDVAGKLVRGDYVQAARGPLEAGKVRILKNEIHSSTGSILKVMAADVSSSWGLKPDWIACDELVEWRYEALWQSLWSATGKRPRSRALIISMAGFDKSHFAWKVREDAQRERDWYFSRQPQCASWIDPAWLAQQERTLPAHVFARLHKCLWVDGVGAYLTAAEVDAIFSTDIPDGTGNVALGVDIGVTKDKSVIAAVKNVKAGPLVVLGLETWAGSKEQKVDLTQVESAALAASIKYSAPIYVDPFQAVQMAQNLTKKGRRVIEYAVTSTSRPKLFNYLLQAIREGRLKSAPHDALRTELLGLEVKETLTGFRVDHKAGRNDDHVFATALALMGALERGESWHLPAFGYCKSTDGTVTLIGGPGPKPDDPTEYATRCPGCQVPLGGTARQILREIHFHWKKPDHFTTGSEPLTIQEVLRREKS